MGAGDDLIGIIDLVAFKLYKFEGAKGEDLGIYDIPEDELELATERRLELMESVSEEDESLMEKYLENGELTTDELKAGIRSGEELLFQPVFAGSAWKTLVCSHCLTPSSITCQIRRGSQHEPIRHRRRQARKSDPNQPDASAPLRALIFKVMSTPRRTVVRARVSGSMKNGDQLFCPNQKKKSVPRA